MDIAGKRNGPAAGGEPRLDQGGAIGGDGAADHDLADGDLGGDRHAGPGPDRGDDRHGDPDRRDDRHGGPDRRDDLHGGPDRRDDRQDGPDHAGDDAAEHARSAGPPARRDGGDGRHADARFGAGEWTILGLETSCDECAAAVVSGRHGAARILSSVVWSQVDLHQAFGGVVPEIAARAHMETVDRVVAAALAEAAVAPERLTHVAATVGPGLQGALLVGATFGKGLARATGLPFVAVNHLEAHVLTPRLTDAVPFPYCVALLSGGHAQYLAALEAGDYRRLGGTIDDAAGEAFDKTAKLLGLGYPGGPAVERMALAGDPRRFAFPTPLARREGCDLSFAGLKTAVRLAAERCQPLTERDVADVCASFQDAVARHLAVTATRALEAFEARAGPPTALVAVGGVAANAVLRAALGGVAARRGIAFVAPPLALCGDNGAMIAYAAIERLGAGIAEGFEARVRSRWPLDAAAVPLLGAGKRGVKA